jgi:beta-glucosidase
MHRSVDAQAPTPIPIPTPTPIPIPNPIPNPTAADQRAAAILAKMTVEEKIDFIGGVDGFFVRGITRLNVPRLKMADGPLGVRNFGPATAMPAGIGLAATWNPKLAERVGVELGRDSRAKGVHFLLAPGVNIYRSPVNGRNFEYFGEDPLLAGRMAVGFIKGVQSQGVAATIKHYIGNNSEFARHKTDTVLDERTMREIYLPAFEAGVKEGQVGALMTAYNLTNGVYMSQNAALNIDVLRKDWGFKGVVMSDWTSTYDAVGAANGGLDLEMPFGKLMNRDSLLPAIAQGKLSEAAIDEKVRRILRLAAEYGWLDRDQTDLKVPRFNTAGRQVALDAAREAVVLLKNDGPLLPLDRAKVRTIAVIGPNGHPGIPAGGGSAQVEPFTSVSLVQGLTAVMGKGGVVHYQRGLPTLLDLMDATEFRTALNGGDPGVIVELFDKPEFSGAPTATLNLRRERWNDGIQSPPAAASRWTTYFTAREAGEHDLVLLGPGETSGYRVFVDGKLVIDSWEFVPELLSTRRIALEAAPHKLVIEQRQQRRSGGFRFRAAVARSGSLVAPEARALAASADVVIVAAGFAPETEAEATDRTFSLPFGQDELIREMAAANKNTVVVLTSGGGVDMSPWLDGVKSVLQAWYAGEEGGTALAGILLGDTNPSGHLPATFERRAADNPAHGNYYPAAGTLRIPYREGIFVGYRGYERNNTKPQFAFGHGLSYTTFQYKNLEVTPGRTTDGNVVVSFDVTNTGSREGADVAQVYVGEKTPAVPRPAKELKGFAKVSLAPGETKRVSVTLDRRSFSYFDTRSGQWRAEAGEFQIMVGRASDAADLRGAVSLAAALSSPR